MSNLGAPALGSDVMKTPTKHPAGSIAPPAKRIKLGKSTAGRFRNVKRPKESIRAFERRVSQRLSKNAEGALLTDEGANLMVDEQLIVGGSVAEEAGALTLAGGTRTVLGILLGPMAALAQLSFGTADYRAGREKTLGISSMLRQGQAAGRARAHKHSDSLGLGDLFRSSAEVALALSDTLNGHHYSFDNSSSTLFKSIAQNMTNNSSIGLAKTMKKKHVYSSGEGKIARGADANVDSVYVHANSLENPHEDAGDVHNALLTDQMMDLYERYYITEATIRVDFFHEGTIGSEGALVGIAVLDDTTTLTKTGHYQEVGNTVWKPINPGEHVSIVYGVKPASYFGSSSISSDDRLQVVAGSDGRPTDALYFHMYCSPLSGNAATAAYNVPFTVTIEYTAVWFDPKSVTQSTA